jgi:hypothetical protein
MTTDSAAYLTNLHNLLNQYFGEDEIHTLCFQMGIDHESVAGKGKSAWIRELLISLGRRGRLAELVHLAQRERPHVSWPTMPNEFQLPASIASPSSSATVVNNYYGEVVQGNVSKHIVKKKGNILVDGNFEMSGGNLVGEKNQVIQGDNVGGDKVDDGQSSPLSPQEIEALDLMRSFATLLDETARHAPAISAKVRIIQAELFRGEAADDEVMADLIADIAEAVPSAIDTLVLLFANPTAANVAGAATNYILRRIRK